MTLSVSAPGKAFLIGEYAVLEGAPAYVTAVDVRAVAHEATAERPAASSAVVHCAHARVAQFLEGRGVAPSEPPAVETGGFTLGPRKLGLGSSAAVAAAVVGYHLARGGLDVTSPEVRAQALALAHAAHSEAQGGNGSGADVATAVHGGTIRFVDRKVEPITLPGWLSLGFVDAGAPAATSSFVHAVKSAQQRDPTRWREAMTMLREAAVAFGEALTHADRGGFAALRGAVELHVRGLRALQDVAGVPIVTDAIAGIVELCARAEVAAKPSGAGGGDLVVLFAPDRGAIDRLAEPLRQVGWPLLSELRAPSEGLRADERVPTVSRLAGFFKLSPAERRRAVAEATGLPPARLDELASARLDEAAANHMIENVVGTFELPLAIATNFRINGRDVLVPMCVEEASVVAAASNAAKMIRDGGGFAAHSDPPWMIAQVQLCRGSSEHEPTAVLAKVREHEAELLALADSAHPRLVGRGGGARAIETRVLADDMAVVNVLVDCQDAMGANLINTVAELVAVRLEAITGWQPGLRILSNLADRRRAHVSARIPPETLAGKGFSGPEVVARIVSASRFAELDPYRAATHNKGIMNGVDAVVLATGNDWRAMEASAHAWAAHDGHYGPLAIWREGADGYLEGRMSLPAAVGVVGGATQAHPVAKLALEILGNPTAAFLGQVMAAAGLASNLAALRALATEGIQRGHMSLHARAVAVTAGATGTEVEQLSTMLVECGEIKVERARALLQTLRTPAQPGRSPASRTTPEAK